MNSRVLDKINDIKRLAARPNAGHVAASGKNKRRVDGLSRAIRTKRDAETFMAELKAFKRN